MSPRRIMPVMPRHDMPPFCRQHPYSIYAANELSLFC